MRGIEILDKVPIYNSGAITPCILLLVIFDIILTVLLSSRECNNNVACILVFVWIAFALVYIFKAPAIGRKQIGTEYKVTISDDVRVKDFIEKYEIVKQEGKIYTAREK